mmetsp:Transcript_113268/g.325633  ORF Transcript_113268/g.325633 Transcript_113268/m.325633 type:complete len:200 (-) Transcript_113268:439-1038(-)
MSFSLLPFTSVFPSPSLTIPTETAMSLAAFKLSSKDFGGLYSSCAACWLASSFAVATTSWNSRPGAKPHVEEICSSSSKSSLESVPLKSKDATNESKSSSSSKSSGMSDDVSISFARCTSSSSISAFDLRPRLRLSPSGGVHTNPRSSRSSRRSGFALTNVPWLRIALTRAPRRRPQVSFGHSLVSAGTSNGCGTKRSP